MAYYFEYNDQSFLYIHIPKTGGSSLEYIINDCNQIHRDDNSIVGHLSLADTFVNRNFEINKLFVFATIRNPWDWYVSWYHWLKTTCDKKDVDFKFELSVINNMTFNDFIFWVSRNKNNLVFKNGNLNTPRYNQYFDWLSIQDKIFVSDVIRLDSYEYDIRRIFGKFNIPVNTISHINTTKHKTYHQLYNNESKQLVAEMHEKDIAFFNFKF